MLFEGQVVQRLGRLRPAAGAEDGAPAHECEAEDLLAQLGTPRSTLMCAGHLGFRDDHCPTQVTSAQPPARSSRAPQWCR